MPYTATFSAVMPDSGGHWLHETFDVTPDIEALGGGIPRADSHGTDLLQLAQNAPEWIRNYRDPFKIEVVYTDEAVPVK